MQLQKTRYFFKKWQLFIPGSKTPAFAILVQAPEARELTNHWLIQLNAKTKKDHTRTKG